MKFLFRLKKHPVKGAKQTQRNLKTVLKLHYNLRIISGSCNPFNIKYPPE